MWLQLGKLILPHMHSTKHARTYTTGGLAIKYCMKPTKMYRMSGTWGNYNNALSPFLLLQEQDSSYTIIKSKETEMVVEDLKPASVYIFQVKQKHQKKHRKITKSSSVSEINERLQIVESKYEYILKYDVWYLLYIYLDLLHYRCEPERQQATARSAGGLSSRPALIVSTSVKLPHHQTPGVFLSVWFQLLSFDSNSDQWACSSFHSGGGHHVGSGPSGSRCWIPAQWTVRLKYTREGTLAGFPSTFLFAHKNPQLVHQ